MPGTTMERATAPATDASKSALLRRALSPNALLAATLLLLALLLALPVVLPIGPMYWDLVLYLDAANRIFDGQVPVLDFFMPVGPLGYYLFAGGAALFEGAQPLLLASWSLLALTAPLMAAVLHHVDQRSRALAFWLLVPFLLFAVLPFNGTDYYPYPGSDGFGIYNRQVCQLLYCLTAALIFVRGARLLSVLVAVSMLALFFLKITGFVAGGLLCLFAFLAGRIPLRAATLAALAFLAALGLLEILFGLTSAYLRDINALLLLNTGSLLPRLLQAASHNFGVILPAAALCLVLVWRDRAVLRRRLSEALHARVLSRGQFAAAAGFADHSAFWLGTALLAGLIFESQNTGSQAMIFVWPVLLAILVDAARPAISRASFVAVTVLCFATALPVAVNTVERAGRAWVGALANNVPLMHRNLKTLGRVNMRPVIDERAARLLAIYPQHRDTFAAYAEAGELPSFLQFSDFDFQVNWLRTTDEAIDAILAYETAQGVRFETILLMDFANPFPWLMGRSGVEHITIGADPFRAVPPPGEAEREAVAMADIALHPTCPVQTSNIRLRALYLPMLTDHTRIELTPCFDAYVRNGLTQGR